MLPLKHSSVTLKHTIGQVRLFHIDKRVVQHHKTLPEPFGFNGLGELVYYRTYARKKLTGGKERWFETVERVVNGTFSMQERWYNKMGFEWKESIAQERARDMYERIFSMKFLPPGRGLWAMGTAVTEERGLFAALNNCAFVSTEDVVSDFSGPFCFMMDAAMLGVGVGFDTKGAGQITIKRPNKSNIRTIVIADSREGWVESIRMLLESYNSNTVNAHHLEFDYSKIRPAGEPIRGFGGESSGPEPLIILHNSIRKTLDVLDGKGISITAIVDIMNMIGRCVVAGNVRRTAEIAFGDAESEEYINLKDYQLNPHRMEYGWTSNNSVFARLGMNYDRVAENVQLNGEPGFAWLENMRNYGRMNGLVDTSDWRASGGNPCLEQTLESYELCCLVETFPDKHSNMQDYLKTLDAAFLYAKTVTLGHTHWPQSNKVMLRNRRIGTSMSGIAQFIASRGIEELRVWSEAGYDRIQEKDKQLSEEFAIPESVKTTCIKPSGTVSLLAGATPGMHAPESRFYIRRVRISSTSELIEPLKAAGFPMEPAVTDPENTTVVSIPIDAGENIRTVDDVSMWEQLSLAAFLQRHWADNQVSCTVTFDPKTEGKQIPHALDFFQYQLKGISFLPKLETGAYDQMPYEHISEEDYKERIRTMAPLDLSHLWSDKETGTTYSASPEISTKVPQSNVPTTENNPVDEFESLQIDDGVHLGNSEESMPDSFCDSDVCEIPKQ